MSGIKNFKLFIYMLISAAIIYAAVAIGCAMGGSLLMTPIQFYEAVGIMGIVVYSAAFFLSANLIFIGFRGFAQKSDKFALNVVEYIYRIIVLLLTVASVVFLAKKVDGLLEIIKGAKLIEMLAAFLFIKGLLIAFSFEIGEFIVVVANRPKKVKAPKPKKIKKVKAVKEAKESDKVDENPIQYVDVVPKENKEVIKPVVVKKASKNNQPPIFNFGRKIKK